MNQRDELLRRLQAQPGAACSGAELARTMRVSRAAVWKHVNALRAAGYDIAGTPGSGYVLRAAPDRLLPAELLRGLATDVVGCRIHHHDSIASTNDEARRLGLEGAPDGLAVVAEEQRQGRGRRGRSWSSPRGGVYVSVLLRPSCHPAQAPRLTLCAAVAVAETIEEILKGSGPAVGIKWPNDVLIDGRKAAGILLELVAREDQVDFVVVGAGLNVNGPPPVDGATSLAAALGRPADRVALCRSLLASLDAVYAAFRAGGWPSILDRWRDRCETLGRFVRVAGAAGSWDGWAVGVDEDGALLLDVEGGGRRRLLAGEVTLRPAPTAR